MSIVLKTPSNGSVTLAEQDTASDVTVTIPARTGTLQFATPPQVTVYASGSGTYTTPANTQYLIIEMVGGGGGGGGSGGGSGSGDGGHGSNGGASTINSTFIVANGGFGGAGSLGSLGQSGGQGGSATGAASILASGQTGTARSPYNTAVSAFTSGGIGGSSAFGKSGGDGGSAEGSSVVLGTGGGGAGYCQALITSPAASYAYAVGTGGGGGAGGTGGFAGQAGVSGTIIITAYLS